MTNQQHNMTPSPIPRLHTGTRLSHVSVFNHVAYLAGQIPRKSIDLGIREQTADVLEQIDALLAEAGSDKSRILSCQIYLKDIGQIAEMNAMWDAWIPAGHTPSRATVQARMADPRCGIEVVVVAAISPASR
jgi:enamine deaminase RidA (YjgF/YER057c/UK114 family)